jgi:hypothetical protein
MKKIDVIIEKGKKEFWGALKVMIFCPLRLEKALTNVLNNLKMLVADYIENEGRND